MNIPSLTDFLKMLVAGGVAGYIIQFLAEKSFLFQSLSANVKILIILTISLILPTIGQVVLLNTPPDVLQAIEPYYTAIATGLVVFLASQGWHKFK